MDRDKEVIIVTTGTGQPGRDIQDRTVETVQLGKTAGPEVRNNMARRGQPELDNYQRRAGVSTNTYSLLSIHPYSYQSNPLLSIYPSFHLSIPPSCHLLPSIHPSLLPSIHPSFHLPFPSFICLFLLPLFIPPSNCSSISSFVLPSIPSDHPTTSDNRNIA